MEVIIRNCDMFALAKKFENKNDINKTSINEQPIFVTKCPLIWVIP